jgi:cytochrome c-type biogenesis protein CcmH/NrfG
MLFDLRGRGRRRTIQVIYILLAFLMGGGLVFFGVGGTPGGILDALKQNSGKTSASSIFSKRVKAAERSVRLHPKDPTAWAALARLRYQDATASGYNQTTSSFTSDGIKKLRGVATAWDRYLSLDPKKPDPNLAVQMVQVFSSGGLNEPGNAVTAMEIVVEGRPPSTGLYSQLAIYAYQAGQTRKGDLAADKAVALAPKDQRAAIRAQLKAAKAQGSTAATQNG